MLPVLGADSEVRIDQDLYGAGADELLAHLRGIDPRVESVLVVGHNPGLQDLAMRLAGDGAASAMQQLRAKFPTGALATLDLGSSEWADLAPGQAYLSALVVPRDLPGVGHGQLC